MAAPKDWTKYEVDEVSPGIYALDATQAASLLHEIDPMRPPCVVCGEPTSLIHSWGTARICYPCDALQPPNMVDLTRGAELRHPGDVATIAEWGHAG